MNQDKIGWLSQQIEIDPLNKSHIIGRSEVYVLQGKYDQAISDYSKAILLQPSRDNYVRRSKLLQDKGKFALAIQDLADARTLSMDSQEVTAADIYLETSVCMTNIKEASEMAELVEQFKEKDDPQPYIQTLVELLHIQEMKLNEQATSRTKQIQELKAYYEEQSKSLKNFFINQLNELKLKINESVQNYQQKFKSHIASMKLTQTQRLKMTLYFETFSSEAEKYYIAAKNLRKVEDKSLRFEDFQGIMIYKGRSEFMKKLYHFFDKYSSQIQKIVSIIQNIPYIGCTFNVIKAAMKGKGWVDEANMQNQCINIEQIAINTTAFNQIITNLAYFTTFYFQGHILDHHPTYRSQWQLLLDRIKTIKREQLGVGKYKQQNNQELDAIKDYATIHASIFMIGVACNCFTINKEILKQANQKQLKPTNSTPQITHIFKIIEQTETILRKKEDTQTQKTQKGYCGIY